MAAPPVARTWPNVFRLGSVLVVMGIVAMHGALLTIALGALSALALYGLLDAEPGLPGAALGVPPTTGRVLAAEYPVIGTTVIALAFAEFWEELTEPHLASRVFHTEVLALVMAIAGIAVICCRIGLEQPRLRNSAP